MESNLSTEEILDKFHTLEKECIGYDNYVNCTDENYTKTLEGLRQVVSEIQRNSFFSSNEELKEVATENLKLLMAPYWEADVLYRIMDSRAERVKLAHVFYIEYLRLLNHYGVLEPDQVKIWKLVLKKQKVKVTMERTDAMPEEIKEMQEIMKDIEGSRPSPYEDREMKVAEFKLRKLIS
mgnify:CR=1 FL=1